MSGDPVDVAVLREAFLRSGVSKSEACRRLGWFYTYPDTNRLSRTLGTMRHNGRFTETTSYDRALAIVTAIGVDPVDVGL